MPRLIEVETDYLALADSVMDCEERGEAVPDEALASLREAVVMVSEKREGVALFFDFLEERAAALREQEKRIAVQRKAVESATERMRGYVLGVMKATGVQCAVGATHKFVVGRSESVEVACPDALPDDLCRIKREPDKTAIKKALESGVRIEPAAGARIQSHDRLQIKPLAAKDRPGDTLLAAK